MDERSRNATWLDMNGNPLTMHDLVEIMSSQPTKIGRVSNLSFSMVGVTILTIGGIRFEQIAPHQRKVRYYCEKNLRKVTTVEIVDQ